MTNHHRSTTNIARLSQAAMLCALLALFSGCASITNPVANGIPVRLLPEELLAEPKEDLEPIPLTWLRRKPADTYQLAPGDILGVYIEGVLGETDQLPPINFPELAQQAPSIGFPIPIRENGTVPMPLVKDVKVEGMNIEEAQDAIERAYTVEKEIIKADEARVIVTLIRPRRAKILVIREDTPTARSAPQQNFNVFNRAAPILQNRGQGTGTVLELPATESDLLSVLAQTGGLPGPNAAQEVIIQRGYSDDFDEYSDGNGGFVAPESMTDGMFETPSVSNTNRRTVRIPLRWRPGVEPPFTSADVRLRSGDIVYIPAEGPQVYYTGGLLPSREVGLPRDQDLGVLEALLRVGGPLINGGINANNLSGGIVGSGIGNPSPSQLTVLRRTPDNRQIIIRVDLHRATRDPRENLLVKSGDVLILQETQHEAITRYFTTITNFNLGFNWLDRGSALGSGAISLP